jgi:hypothetical protein
MSSTRSVKSPGVWGADASTSIPPSPLAGVAYRNTALTLGQTRGGWAFDTLVDSAKFNELLYRYGSLLDIMDRQGVLGWSDQVDYAVPALVWGSDGALYRCLLASGPSSTVRDPVSAPAGYWDVLAHAGASSSKTATGWVKLPGGLIMQWGTTTAAFGALVTLPLAWPTAALFSGTSDAGEGCLSAASAPSGLTQIQLWARVPGSGAASAMSHRWWALGY